MCPKQCLAVRLLLPCNWVSRRKFVTCETRILVEWCKHCFRERFQLRCRTEQNHMKLGWFTGRQYLVGCLETPVTEKGRECSMSEDIEFKDVAYFNILFYCPSQWLGRTTGRNQVDTVSSHRKKLEQTERLSGDWATTHHTQYKDKSKKQTPWSESASEL
jgi:hypothetical protein